ncbi:MAG: TIGR03016 family PEP-CTERM system-associated outer membrane protein [Motiliproteus sp.]
MAIITLTPSCLGRSLLGLALLSAPCYSEQTKDWDISPSLQLGLDYSDNLDLAPSDKTETFIGTLAPGISISRQGRYLKLGADYRLSLLDYSSNTRSDSYFHNLNAFADAELIEDHLFVDAQAVASQQLIDNRSTGIIDPKLAPDAFTNTLTFAFTPTWRQRIGDYTNMTLSASYDAVIYQTNAEDSEGFSYNLGLDTRGNPNRIYWTLETRQDSAKSSTTNNTLNKNDFAQMQLGYRHSRLLDLHIGGGYSDSHIDNPSDSDISSGSTFWSAGLTLSPMPQTSLNLNYNDQIQGSSFWSGGLTWSPNPRISLDLNYSDQIQSGNSSGVVFTHRLKRSTLSLSVQQSLSSVRQQQLELGLVVRVCPGGDANSPECRFIAINSPEFANTNPNDFVNFGVSLLPSLDEGRFISQALNANYSYRLRKSNVSLGLTANRRKFQTLSKRIEDDFGLNLAWALQLSSRSSMTISYDGSVLAPDTTTSERDYRQGLNLGFSRTLSADTSLSTALRFNKLHSNDTSRAYEEYGAGVSLNHTF